MPLALTQSTAPSTEPITTAEAKLFARIVNLEEDSLVADLIASARAALEAWTGRQFVPASWTWLLDRFPRHERRPSDGYWDRSRSISKSELVVPKYPLRGVTSINYLDEDGNSQLLAATVYDVATSVEPGRIRLAFDQTWPETRVTSEAITIVYVAGYSDAVDTDPVKRAAVPAAARTAIRMLVDDVYEHRAASAESALRANPAIQALLDGIGLREVIG